MLKEKESKWKMGNEKYHYETDRYFKAFMIMLKEGILDSYLKPYVKFVKKYAKPGSKMLDLGCGAGVSTNMLSGHYDVTGADYSTPFINYAKGHYKKIEFKKEDARKLSFKDGSFDVVGACGFIEHINEVDRVLGEMLRVTKKGGLIIIVSPNWFSPFRAIRGFINPKDYETIGRNRFQQLGWFFYSIYQTLKKLVNPTYVFRNPNLEDEELISNDIDMVYVANQYDLQKFFRKNGHKVLKLNADTFSYSFIPMLSPWLGVVVKKLK